MTEHTSLVLLGGVLFVRGMGLGASIQPTVAAASATLQTSRVGRTMIWSVGMSLLALIAAVVLLRAERASRPLGKSARAEDGQFRVVAPGSARGVH